jgi:hypothetical protein
MLNDKSAYTYTFDISQPYIQKGEPVNSPQCACETADAALRSRKCICLKVLPVAFNGLMQRKRELARCTMRSSPHELMARFQRIPPHGPKSERKIITTDSRQVDGAHAGARAGGRENLQAGAVRTRASNCFLIEPRDDHSCGRLSAAALPRSSIVNRPSSFERRLRISLARASRPASSARRKTHCIVGALFPNVPPTGAIQRTP